MPHARIDPIVPSARDAKLAKTARRALERSVPFDKTLRVRIRGRRSGGDDSRSAAGRCAPADGRSQGNSGGQGRVAGRGRGRRHDAASGRDPERSRPFVVGLINKGLLPVRMVGNQRRLPLRDVLAYKADNRARRHETSGRDDGSRSETRTPVREERRPSAFLDASALYPALLRNILMRLAVDDLFRAYLV